MVEMSWGSERSGKLFAAWRFVLHRFSSMLFRCICSQKKVDDGKKLKPNADGGGERAPKKSGMQLLASNSEDEDVKLDSDQDEEEVKMVSTYSSDDSDADNDSDGSEVSFSLVVVYGYVTIDCCNF